MQGSAGHVTTHKCHIVKPFATVQFLVSNKIFLTFIHALNRNLFKVQNSVNNVSKALYTVTGTLLRPTTWFQSLYYLLGFCHGSTPLLKSGLVILLHSKLPPN